MRKKFIHFILLCVFVFVLPISIQEASAAEASVMKVKPSHTTAVYENNSKHSQKLFHTTAHQHVIVHKVEEGGWAFIQDGTHFGYIANSSLTAASPYRAMITTKDTLVRNATNFELKAIQTLQAKQAVQAFPYNKEWTIVAYNEHYGYVPASRVQKVTIKNGKYSTGVMTKQKRVAITFDDGPNTTYTPKILKILSKYNVKATFFTVGANVTKHPTIAKQIVEQGHEIGNHTYNHPSLNKLSASAINKELTLTNKAIEKATGTLPTVFRPPYGAYNQTVMQSANMPTILWSIDTLDWKHKNPQKVLQSVKNNVKNGSIILMHDANKGSLNGLESVIQYLQKNGYEIVTVTEVLTPNL